jgi:glycosyltransferase involved in cell wall biosynthesis
MWNNNGTPATVIQHGVIDPGALYTGKKERGIVVINGIVKRGRRLGLDIFLRVREEIPLDIVGMGSEEVGGLGELNIQHLPAFISQYRFFFNPIRYTSLGLSVCEALMAGLPVVGFSTTEMPVTIQNDYSGYISTDENFLVEKMKMLLKDAGRAQELSKGARKTALEKFNIDRFKKNWLNVFHTAVNKTFSGSIIEGTLN